MQNLTFDWQAFVKYLFEGLGVALAAFYIPRRNPRLEEIAMIALTAAATFALLDQFSPSVASGARKGSGFGIGYQLATTGVPEGFGNNEDESTETDF